MHPIYNTIKHKHTNRNNNQTHRNQLKVKHQPRATFKPPKLTSKRTTTTTTKTPNQHNNYTPKESKNTNN